MNPHQGVDVAWVAVDTAGRLAVFTTAGVGPMPASALRALDAAEAAMSPLPAVGGRRLLGNYSRPDYFVAFDEIGLFAYDWGDAHRTSAGSSGCYDLVAVPLRPVLVGELPKKLRLPFEATVITSSSFGAPQCRIATQHFAGADA